MLAAGREKKGRNKVTAVLTSLRVLHRHVWYLCVDIHQASLPTSVCGWAVWHVAIAKEEPVRSSALITWKDFARNNVYSTH